jgi:hypothetical protein
MDTKLTLKLDRAIIEHAKEYARTHQVSLSHLIETYLGSLTKLEQEIEITPLVKRLSGVMELPKNADEKKLYKDHVLKKYAR